MAVFYDWHVCIKWQYKTLPGTHVHRIIVVSSHVSRLQMVHMHLALGTCVSAEVLGLVVQSIVSLTSPLRGQFVKCLNDFITKFTEIFC